MSSVNSFTTAYTLALFPKFQKAQNPKASFLFLSNIFINVDIYNFVTENVHNIMHSVLQSFKQGVELYILDTSP